MAVEKLIVGLGNPGGEYRATRHNAGFILVDRLASRWGVHWRSEKRFFAEFADVVWNGQRVGMAKPQTFMNLSGKAVEAIVGFFRVEPGNILVVVDDADLPLGTIRLRGDGSPGGHHGLESVEQCLGSRAYPRLRLGIARPESGVRNISGHVLGRFQPDEIVVLEKVLDRAAVQVETWLNDGVGKAMNLFNGSID